MPRGNQKPICRSRKEKLSTLCHQERINQLNKFIESLVRIIVEGRRAPDLNLSIDPPGKLVLKATTGEKRT